MVTESVQKVIDTGLMAVASSDYVLEFLRRYVEVVKADPYGFHGNADLERVLLDRADATIDIALAASATEAEILKEIYSRGRKPAATDAERHYLRALRVSALSNEVCESFCLSAFPRALMTEEDLVRLVVEGEWAEICSLFQNEKVDPRLLEDLFAGTGPCEGLPDERRREIVAAATKNKRLVTNHDSADGPDLQYMGIHRKIEELVASVPTTLRWCYTLHDLLWALNPFDLPGPYQSILPALERWRSIDEDKEGFLTELRANDELRCMLGAVYGRHYERKPDFHAVLIGSATSEDVALRCAFYGRAELDEEAMRIGHEKDGSAYLLAAMNNAAMLAKPGLRKLFEDHQLSGSGLQAHYLRRCKQLAECRPYFNPRPVAEWLTEVELEDTKGSRSDGVPALDRLAAKVEQLEKKSDELASLIARLTTNLVWVVLILGTLIWVRT